MSQKMRFFGPKVHDPSLAAKDAMFKLAREQHRRDVCNARLQVPDKDLEKELQMFSEEFGSRLHDLRISMKEVFHAAPEMKTFSGSPDEAKSEGLDSNSHDLE
ncbi:uncharacterized protein [Physcomitrium patens]|uniref:uncharacterized protein isoform X1 n=1 Tax=Physcomitrium patens TaxID=3218 RepID=UPI000D160ADC|nr:uncharacterized protein LOC112295921 isoform X1 [Physcomitrium patens]XP_024403733.1 uncharacterized protein LOC112295921 isoform X1 [Physcomitrium patens]XP_024403734.1 uncharacterized protein LOC112295921 isoform X1 [Physcomitrium patens]|eukprot:XP_024403731.1 uncharacterized protein LOC112295921 isoform X1 [Physcomitrella patens]